MVLKHRIATIRPQIEEVEQEVVHSCPAATALSVITLGLGSLTP